MLVIGKTGMGKTRLLKNIIVQDALLTDVVEKGLEMAYEP